jgi:ABC-type branched-subunit amino acid transport system ATPase component/predicted MFS family arabinose efflux permease
MAELVGDAEHPENVALLVEGFAEQAAVLSPPRFFVPSEREVDNGLADYSFDPLPPPEPKPPFDLSARLRDFRVAVNPWAIAGDNPVLPLMLIGASALFTQWDDFAFLTLLPEIRNEFGLSIVFIVTLGQVVGLATQVISPITGYLADRISRVRMLAVGNVIQNVASIVAGQSGSVTQLAGSRFIGGTGGAISTPTEFPLLADWYPIEVRARIFNFKSLFGGLGTLVAPVIAGTLGHFFGWRFTLTVLGVFATVISLSFFFLKEPVRGRLDRKSLGADDEVADREQQPVSWSEGWRAAASVSTLRRLWYVTPFLTASGQIQAGFMPFYYADEFGVGTFGRGWILAFGTLIGLGCLPFAGPVTDRLLRSKPGRVFTLFGLVSAAGVAVLVVLAFSPYLWLSIVVSLPLGVVAVLTLPALFTVVSMVVPPRLRSFGIATAAPWQVLGVVMSIIILQLVAPTSIRAALIVLVPFGLIGAVLVGTAGKGVEADIRSARASSMADEAARQAREAGGNKMIICRDVDVTYDGTQVLFNVDFDVEEGELVALLGTNGAGKSTLLRAIAGVQEASNGAIFLDGQDITHRPPHENAAGGIVFMPGGRAVFPTLSVEENLRAAAWMYREDDGYVAQRTEEIYEYFPILRARAKQQAGSMSGGEQQMLALGQAFLMKPRLLMIDELSLGLAPAIVAQLLEIVRAVNAQGTTIILVEQSANVALTVARRAVFMEKGEVRFDGPTAELLGRGDLLRSVFLSGAGGGGGPGGGFIASGGLLKKGGAEQAPEQVLAVEGIRLRFGGHQALRDAHVTVDGGEVVGIIGPNGAGKTTLFDVISGYVKADEGTVMIAGRDATGLTPDARARLGLARSFQSARLFPALTVRENVKVALEQRLHSRSILAAAAWLPKVRTSERRAARRVEYLLDLMNLEAYATKFVNELSTGSRRMVDMACVMAAEPRLLLLDEPSSGLAQAEVEVLGPVVRRMARESGCGVLVIEHEMTLIQALSDRLVAMELGSVLLEGLPAEVIADERVVQAYLGASDAVISRSGSALAEALVVAGVAGRSATPSQSPSKQPQKRTRTS